ncbi:MAG: histone deacetylase [Candidatus Hydrogenedentes bacterium]|nr:histone deacetylase [Candidatus Hydrogenedentota bacterium]
MARTGFVYHADVVRHDTGPMHPECPDRMRSILDAVKKAGLELTEIEALQSGHTDLLRVHTEQHIAEVLHHCTSAARYPDPDTPMGAGSWEAAMWSAGAGLAACNAVLNGRVDNAFTAMRPPGHHAERDRAMGFCLFNNVAVAARWLRAEAGLNRVAIIDWDVHHGNGTQNIFYEDDAVYYVSMHQHPFYPGTGHPHERGKNRSNLNIQMPAGGDEENWLSALDNEILPELERFDPDFLLLSCGFDAHQGDPIGGQRLSTEAFAEMTRRIRPVANGKVVSLLEGGYSLRYLGEAAVAHVQALRSFNGKAPH